MFDEAWSNAAAAFLAMVGAIGVALIGRSSRPAPEPIPIQPSPDLTALAERFNAAVDKAISAVRRVEGQVEAVVHSVDKVDGLRERLAVVEDAIQEMKPVLEDTNNEMHKIKHGLNNALQKMDALGVLARRSSNGGMKQ